MSNCMEARFKCMTIVVLEISRQVEVLSISLSDCLTSRILPSILYSSYLCQQHNWLMYKLWYLKTLELLLGYIFDSNQKLVYFLTSQSRYFAGSFPCSLLLHWVARVKNVHHKLQNRNVSRFYMSYFSTSNFTQFQMLQETKL